MLVLYPSGLLISPSKVMDTDCCELTLILPFTTFSQGELEKAKSAMDELQGLKEGTLFSGREISGADSQKICVMEELRTWDTGVLGFPPSRTQLLPLCHSPFLLLSLLCQSSLPQGSVPMLLPLKPTALPTTGVFHLCIRAQLDSELVFEISNNLITFINSILLRLSQSY